MMGANREIQVCRNGDTVDLSDAEESEYLSAAAGENLDVFMSALSNVAKAKSGRLLGPRASKLIRTSLIEALAAAPDTEPRRVTFAAAMRLHAEQYADAATADAAEDEKISTDRDLAWALIAGRWDAKPTKYHRFRRSYELSPAHEKAAREALAQIVRRGRRDPLLDWLADIIEGRDEVRTAEFRTKSPAHRPQKNVALHLSIIEAIEVELAAMAKRGELQNQSRAIENVRGALEEEGRHYESKSVETIWQRRRRFSKG
jgi:hypothetical protein